MAWASTRYFLRWFLFPISRFFFFSHRRFLPPLDPRRCSGESRQTRAIYSAAARAFVGGKRNGFATCPLRRARSCKTLRPASAAAMTAGRRHPVPCAEPFPPLENRASSTPRRCNRLTCRHRCRRRRRHHWHRQRRRFQAPSVRPSQRV